MDKTLALLIIDTVVSLATYFITKYVAPEAAEGVLYVLAGLQPILVYVVKSWKDKEVALINQGIDPKTRRSFR